MTKKIPMRTCIGCGQTKEKKDLVRIARTPEGKFLVDRTGKSPGRGAYLCRDPECLKKALKKDSFKRAFGEGIPEEAKESLLAELGALGGPDHSPGGAGNAG